MKNILFFPWRDWNSYKREGFRTREANILKTFVKSNKVGKILCINRSTQPKYIEFLLKNRKNYLFKRTKNINTLTEQILYKRTFSKLTKINNKLYVLDIFYHLPNPKGNRLERNKLFAKILEQEINYAVSIVELGKNYLTWSCDITRSSLVNKFKNRNLVYDIIDNLIEHDQVGRDKEFYKKKYKEIEDISNIIFTVSKSIKAELFSSHGKTYYIPNGIDLSKYHVQKNIENKRPKVGYVGLMQERIDVKLLKYVIEKNGDIDFCFVGPILTPKYFKELLKYKNVEFIGAVHHDLIPNYINNFDACIIPHKVNKFTKSMNPLKLYEYLACGKHVITTNIPPAEEFKDIIYITNEYEIFSNYVHDAVYKPYSNFSQEMISNKIKLHDWENKIQEMINIIEKFGD
ncbi:glycosyltransferase [Fictibacillus barbaricus]|uniref:Glycosyltransferase n=1 Tax=Fictibacillus barbaricus TaxID=182136 RepID=A0ABS2ZGS0_9BACL|nr:glycosyltransferase [Fictibacillus barbaricus]MBN3546523.1 glycosyltransferase [Fictibacillus barbaricus]GGB41694.1 glycosyl transferase [Fictibacillus barbaricus]